METARTVAFLKKKIGVRPETAFILGSGLGGLADILDNRESVSYGKIPGFPSSGVHGHANLLSWGGVGAGGETRKCLLVFSGRFHFYEGFDFSEVTAPVRVAAGLGVKTIVVTNAAGGINRSFKPGDIMLITDHINLMGANPLRGYSGTLSKFVGMTRAYDRDLAGRAVAAARELRIGLKRGVYAGFSGPSYETPAEIRMLRRLGADAVGMSTVPETIVARQEGMRVLGLSLVTNMAAGVTGRELDHSEVLETSAKAGAKMLELLKKIV